MGGDGRMDRVKKAWRWSLEVGKGVSEWCYLQDLL